MIDIERLASEAGMCDALCNDSHNGEVVMIVRYADVQRFAALVRNEVLEEAAKVCDEAADSLEAGKRTNQVDRHTADVLRVKAAAIRALKVKT